MPLEYITENRERPNYNMELGGERQRKAAQRARQQAAVVVEGEYVTTAEIGVRIGMSQKAARERLAKVKKMPGAVTWDRLRGMA